MALLTVYHLTPFIYYNEMKIHIYGMKNEETGDKNLLKTMTSVERI